MGEIVGFVCSNCNYDKSYFLGTGISFSVNSAILILMTYKSEETKVLEFKNKLGPTCK